MKDFYTKDMNFVNNGEAVDNNGQINNIGEMKGKQPIIVDTLNGDINLFFSNESRQKRKSRMRKQKEKELFDDFMERTFNFEM